MTRIGILSCSSITAAVVEGNELRKRKMGGGASIDVTATGSAEDKVRLNDVADAHYRRELSKVITYLRS